MRFRQLGEIYVLIRNVRIIVLDLGVVIAVRTDGNIYQSTHGLHLSAHWDTFEPAVKRRETLCC